MELSPVPILSDLDGTLIDSTASVVAAFRWWVRLRGLPEETLERIPFGRTSSDAASVLAPELDSEAEGALLDERQVQDTRAVVAFDGAFELLSAHANLAVVTSCPRRLAEARLNAAGLPVPRVLVTPECWSRGKPDPEPYLRGAALLGVEPRDCIVLEDAPSGVEAGVRAGMRVVAMLTTHSPGELERATCRIRSLSALPDALSSLDEQ
ncbi:HAD-IA family hydrolase [Arhodomonas sp. AD133]|uniref:HAD-IA family hydrolase n=1 Tax=Arhodomonas sp. AD133 TaxID=3415009 RepID=UPI003EB6EB42